MTNTFAAISVPALEGRTGRRPVRAALIAAAALASIGVLAGCGGGSSVGGSAAGAGSGASSGDSKAAYTDAQACDWLKANPATSPNPVFADGQLASAMLTFFEAHGGVKDADAFALDEALTRGCPDLRAANLKKADAESFGGL